jgi:hypothetical protein
MSTKEYSDFAFVNEAGTYKRYTQKEGIPIKHWVFSFHWTEPDNAHVTADRVVLHIDQNPMYSFEYAQQVFARASKSLPESERKGLEKMLRQKGRIASFSKREL